MNDELSRHGSRSLAIIVKDTLSSDDDLKNLGFSVDDDIMTVHSEGGITKDEYFRIFEIVVRHGFSIIDNDIWKSIGEPCHDLHLRIGPSETR